MGDTVDHPSHYNSHPSGVEAITIVEHFSFNTGNAIKYLWRAGLKEGTDEITDLRKAAWYAQREIERLQALRAGRHDEASGGSYVEFSGGDDAPGVGPAGAGGEDRVRV